MKKTLFAWLLILFTGAIAGFAANEILIPARAAWSYNDTGTDLGTAWRQPDYNDTSWLVGAAQLGYGDGDETTVIRSSPVFSCFYFRHSFSIADPARYQSLNLEILRDDGAVVYLNGAEVARYNMPAGAISYGTWASSASEYAWDSPQSIANLLVAGNNVIAVEVHQGNSTSTDVSLDLKLTGTSEISIVLDSPVSGAIGVPLDAPLNATVTDPEGQNLTVTFYGRPSEPAQPDFSLIVLPDIQNYTAEINGGTRAILASQTDWIRANRDNLNIAYVAQMGDISQNGDSDTDQSEWINASSALYTLENPLPQFPEGIPYGVAVGNHDEIVPAGDSDPTTFYNQYFGVAHFAGKSYYGGHYGTRNNNYYEVFSTSGVDFIVIYLEYDTTPDQAVLDWANTLLQSDPNRRGLVVTHYFLEVTGAWGTPGLTIYNALKANPNLFLMLCGHNHAETQRTDVYAGNTVYTLMQDFQTYAYGGSGFLRIFEFSPSNNQIRIRTYSPWLNQFETDTNSQFTLNYNMDSGSAYTMIQQNVNVPSGSQTTANWNGLQPGAAYDWYVTATDGVDVKTSEISRFTTSIQVENPPAAPSFLIATAKSDTEIALTWSDNANNETCFEIYQSSDGIGFSLAGTVQANQTGAIVAGLQPATAYFFKVRAINASGYSEYSNQATDVTFPPPSVPVAPGNLTASPVSTTVMQLAWTDNSSDETGFQVERSVDQATWTSLAMVGPNVTSLLDSGLASGTPYYYRVSARNGSSASAPSGKAAAAPFIDSYASSETLVVGTLQGSMANTLANDASYEQITEKLSGGKPNVRYSTLQHQWTIQAAAGKSVVFWVQAHRTASADGETFVFSYSTDNVTFQDMVAVTDMADKNTYQSFALPNTLQGTVFIRVLDTDHKIGNVALDTLFVDHMLIRTDASPILAPPSTPVLQQANAGNESVTLKWDSSSGATSYSVWRKTIETDYLIIASGITATTYSDTGLVNGATYDYAITAVNSFGESLFSNQLSATPQAPAGTEPPTALAATAAKRKITLSWTQSLTPGVTQNVIYRSADNDGTYTPLATIAPSGSYSDSVASGATWYYVVTALANGVESPVSNIASATAK